MNNKIIVTFLCLSVASCLSAMQPPHSDQIYREEFEKFLKIDSRVNCKEVLQSLPKAAWLQPATAAHLQNAYVFVAEDDLVGLPQQARSYLLDADKYPGGLKCLRITRLSQERVKALPKLYALIALYAAKYEIKIPPVFFIRTNDVFCIEFFWNTIFWDAQKTTGAFLVINETEMYDSDEHIKDKLERKFKEFKFSITKKKETYALRCKKMWAARLFLVGQCVTILYLFYKFFIQQ